MCFFFFFSLFARFSLKSHSPCRKKKIFEKQKKKKEKTWTRFWLKKRQILDQVLTLQHIYIYQSIILERRCLKSVVMELSSELNARSCECLNYRAATIGARHIAWHLLWSDGAIFSRKGPNFQHLTGFLLTTKQQNKRGWLPRMLWTTLWLVRFFYENNSLRDALSEFDIFVPSEMEIFSSESSGKTDLSRESRVRSVIMHE